MKIFSADRLALLGAVFALGAVILLIVMGSLLRIPYPFDLEWMEGGMLVHVQRLQEGLGLFVEPDADFVPYIYPPGYPAFLALLGEPSYTVGRIVSLCSVFAASIALVFAVREAPLEDGQQGATQNPWFVGVGAAAVFLSTYEDSGAFFDLVRADGLAMGLVAWALVTCRRGTINSVRVGGLLLAFAFFAKHNFAAVGLPILIWLLKTRERRVAIEFVKFSVAPALAFLLYWSIKSSGLFLVYLLQVPATHRLVGERGWPGAELEMWGAMPIVATVAVFAMLWVMWSSDVDRKSLNQKLWRFAFGASSLLFGVVTLTKYRREVGFDVRELIGWSSFGAPLYVTGIVVSVVFVSALVQIVRRLSISEGALFWTMNGGVMFALAAVMRAHHGGFLNVLIPGYWVVALLSGLALGALVRKAGRLSLIISALFIGQVYEGRWDPSNFSPREGDVEAGERLLEVISSYDGEVWVPHAPWYPVMVGKRPSLPLIALWDVDYDDGPLYGGVAEVRDALSSHKWDAIISSGRRMRYGVANHYTRSQTIAEPIGTFMTRSGWRVRPSVVWEPRIAD